MVPPQNKKSWETIEGSAYPLGVTYIKEEDAFNFALYSKHATEVTLLVYNDDDFVNPLFIYQFTYLINKSNRIWHCRIKAEKLNGAKYYAYICKSN